VYAQGVTAGIDDKPKRNWKGALLLWWALLVVAAVALLLNLTQFSISVASGNPIAFVDGFGLVAWTLFWWWIIGGARRRINAFDRQEWEK